MDILSFVDPTLLGGLAACVVLAGVIVSFMKYSFTSQEIAYGEHISTLYGSSAAAKSKAAKAAEKKKRAKQAKAANQAKAAAANSTGSEGHNVQHHVEINPEVTLLGEDNSTGGGQATGKTKVRKRKTSKSILHNKDEVPLVRAEEVESRLEFTAKGAPEDEAEMRHRKISQHQSENLVSQAPPTSDVKDTVVSPPEEVVEDVVLPVKSSNVEAANTQSTNGVHPQISSDASSDNTDSAPNESSKKSNRKSKSKRAVDAGKQQGNEQIVSKVEDMLGSIDQSELSKTEMQQLIGSLVTNRCPDTWEKKDKLVDLTNQLQVLQKALDRERASLAWTGEQLQECNNKLALAERTQQGTNTQLQELQMRLAQSRDQHRAEVQGIQQARFQEMQRMQQHIQQLREENQNLRQALPNTDEVAQMRTQLRALETELQDQQRHVVKSEAKCQDLNSRLNSANEAYRQENMRCVELVSRADELSFKHTRLEKQLTDTQTRAHAAENDLRNLQDHLRTKDLEIKELHSEILAAKQTTTETISSTSQADNSKILQLEDSVNSLQRAVDSKQVEIDNLQTKLSQAKEELDNAAALNSQSNDTAVVENGKDRSEVSHLEDQLLRLQSEVDTLRDKNNGLRKKNWSMSESLKKAEDASLSTSLLESDLEKKSSQIHELKACNQTLKESNNELQGKIDILNNSVSRGDQLQQDFNQLKHTLAEKDETIHSLEMMLAEEKERVTATELECKNILENELHQSLATLEDQHNARIDHLQALLDQSEARITDLESLLHQSESIIKQIVQRESDRAVNGSSEIEELRRKLTKSQEEKKLLQNKISLLESNQSDGDSDTAEELTVYFNAEIQRLQHNVEKFSDSQEFDDNHNVSSNGNVSVKLVPVHGDLDVTRAELRRQLASTQRQLSKTETELEILKSRSKYLSPNPLSAEKVKAMMRKFQPNIALDSSSTLEESIQEFYNQAISNANTENAEENQYKQTLIETEAMLDKLSETWQSKLDEKDSQISRLQIDVAEYQTKLHNLSLATKHRTSTPVRDLTDDMFTSSSQSPAQSDVSKDTDTDTASNSSELFDDMDDMHGPYCTSCRRSQPRRVSQLLAMRLASSGSLHDVSSTV